MPSKIVPMRTLLLPFTPRYIVLTLALVCTAALVVLIYRDPDLSRYLAAPLAVFIFLTLVGLHDLVQKEHSILRSYPIAAHIQFLLEAVRPEMRQYFFESGKDGAPFPRDKRAIVYQRAKGVLDKRPFGTEYDVSNRATNGCTIGLRRRAGTPSFPHLDWRPGLHTALRGVCFQHLGNELWRLVRKCHPRLK